MGSDLEMSNRPCAKCGGKLGDNPNLWWYPEDSAEPTTHWRCGPPDPAPFTLVERRYCAYCGSDRQAAARITELEAALSAEKAKVAEAVRELGMVADYVESHWQGAGLPLKADWIIREVSSWTTSYERNADELDAAREAAEAEAARLREAIHAVQDATAAYLPPDGIDAQECLNRILQATDNPTINAITLGAQYGRP